MDNAQQHRPRYTDPDAAHNRHMSVCHRLNVLYTQKNHDYGNSFHQSYIKHGLIAPTVRMGDKMARLETLVSAQNEVKDESIYDTLLDLANYAIMTLMEINAERDAAAEEQRRKER